MKPRAAGWFGILFLSAIVELPSRADTVALWLFDEPGGLYPSSNLNDASGHEYQGLRNVVARQPVALGNVFMDPNAPPESRWKYFSGIRKRAMFVFTSPDGWSFEPHEVAALPFSAGSQSIVYYDDQRQLYVGHHRSDYGMTPGGHTRRRFVRSETKAVLGQTEAAARAARRLTQAAQLQKGRARTGRPPQT
jgi:hypothetical protein